MTRGRSVLGLVSTVPGDGAGQRGKATRRARSRNASRNRSSSVTAHPHLALAKLDVAPVQPALDRALGYVQCRSDAGNRRVQVEAQHDDLRWRVASPCRAGSDEGRVRIGDHRSSSRGLASAAASSSAASSSPSCTPPDTPSPPGPPVPPHGPTAGRRGPSPRPSPPQPVAHQQQSAQPHE